MPRVAYFFDKVTGKIIGRNVHMVKDTDNPGSIKEADADLSDIWEEIRSGKKWPDILERVTDKNPDNLDLIYADDIPHGYNEYKPSKLASSEQLERRPYFELMIVDGQQAVKKFEEHDKHCSYEIDTTGGVTLEMEAHVRSTQGTVQKHGSDKKIKGIDGVYLVECSLGILNPRDGQVSMKNGVANFQWILPDTTTKEFARCFIRDPDGEILISKSLRVKCR